MKILQKKWRVTFRPLFVLLMGSLVLAGCGTNSSTYTISPNNTQVLPAFCSQPDVKSAERWAVILNPDAAHISLTIPQGEPRIVAVVDGQSISAARLEMQIQNAVHTNQIASADAGPQPPPSIQAALIHSPAKLRRVLLTQLVDNVLWMEQGQSNGEGASIADAQARLKRSLATFQNSPTNSPARIQFEAFLCANHLTEASYTTDSRVVQNMQNMLTILAAKAHVRSMLPPDQQDNSSAVENAENAYIQSLWTKHHVQVFLKGFVPLRV